MLGGQACRVGIQGVGAELLVDLGFVGSRVPARTEDQAQPGCVATGITSAHCARRAGDAGFGPDPLAVDMNVVLVGRTGPQSVDEDERGVQAFAI